MVILDAVEKATGIEVLQAELNDQPGVCLKLTGGLGAIQGAADVASQIAQKLEVAAVVDVIPSPDASSRKAYQPKPDFNPLIEQATVHEPSRETKSSEAGMSEQANFAIGLIETQGFTAVFEAIDTAVKAASVEVVAREKLGGGYITVVIKGDVAAVRAAVEAGSAKVASLGRLIAAHVIPSPSKAVLSLLPPIS